MVVGNQRKFPAALVVPNYEKLTIWAKTKSIPTDDADTMARHPDVVEFILTEIERLSDGFASYERIKRISLLPHEFTLEKGELTPTMKVKRKVIESRYKGLIDEMYQDQADA